MGYKSFVFFFLPCGKSLYRETYQAAVAAIIMRRNLIMVNIFYPAINRVDYHPARSASIIAPIMSVQRNTPVGQALITMLLAQAKVCASNPDDVVVEDFGTFAIYDALPNLTLDEKKLVLMVTEDAIHIGVGLNRTFSLPQFNANFAATEFYIHPDAKVKFYHAHMMRMDFPGFWMEYCPEAKRLAGELERRNRDAYFGWESGVSISIDDSDMDLAILFGYDYVSFGTGARRVWT